MTRNNYKKELERFLSNKIFIWSVVIIALLCYGYSATNTTISIDDVQGDYYFGSGNVMLAAGRFAMTFWAKMIGFGDAMPPYTFAIEMLAVACFIWSAINFCILFSRVTKDKINDVSLNIFAILLVSYPLINEIWEYSGANLIVCIGYLCVSFIMLLLQNMIAEKKVNICSCIVAVALMILVAAGYESLVVVYIFAVTAVLFLSVAYESKNFSWKEMFAQIGIYVAALIAGIVGRVVIDKILLAVLHLEETTNGATSVLWGSAPFGELVDKLITEIVNTYVLRAIIYFPLTELIVAVVVLCVAILIIAVRQKSVKIFLPGIGCMISLIALSLLQGTVAPYRTCQVFGVFVAFCALLVVEAVKGNKYLKTVCTCALIVLAVNQSMYLSYFLNLNHIRSEEEMELLEDVGDDLETYNSEKPVVFLGEYSLSDYVVESYSVDIFSKEWFWYSKMYAEYNQLEMDEIYRSGNRKIVSTNVKSVINWAVEPTGGQSAIKKIFRYLGYNYQSIDDKEALMNAYLDACNYMQVNHWDTGINPEWKGSYAIIETPSYLIVHFR